MKLGIGWERSEEGSNGRNWGWICPKQAFLMGRNGKIVFFERLTLDIYLLIKKKPGRHGSGAWAFFSFSLKCSLKNCSLFSI